MGFLQLVLPLLLSPVSRSRRLHHIGGLYSWHLLWRVSQLEQRECKLDNISRGYDQVTDCLMRTQAKVKKGDHGEPGLLPPLPHHLVDRQVRIMKRECGFSEEINLGDRVAANLWTYPSPATHQMQN